MVPETFKPCGHQLVFIYLRPIIYCNNKTIQKFSSSYRSASESDRLSYPKFHLSQLHTILSLAVVRITGSTLKTYHLFFGPLLNLPHNVIEINPNVCDKCQRKTQKTELKHLSKQSNNEKRQKQQKNNHTRCREYTVHL